MKNSVLVQKFIEQIWNKRSFEMLDDFLHPAFKDHSLLPILSADKEGLKKWINATGISFEHETVIEDHVTEGDKIMLRIKMKLKHIGVWRGINPTGIELYTTGYRHFKIKDDRIIEHWALIDGETIENQLKEASRGCKIAR